MNRKIIIGIICFIIVACLAVGIGMNNKGSNSEEKTVSILNKETASTVDESSVSGENAETKKEIESVRTEQESQTRIQTKTSSAKKANKAKSSVKNTSSTEKVVTSSVKTEKEPQAPEKSTEKKSLTVSFSVNCEKAAQYDAEYPKYLISHTKCDVKDSTTVFDLLSEQCRKNGIAVVHQNKSYIKSIGGLGEKDCGNGSGWIYKVNGVKPMMSASKYVLKNGDVVEWYYVTSPTD